MCSAWNNMATGEGSMIHVRSFVFLGTIVCLASPALASKKDARDGRASTRTERERAAKKACLNGDPAKGIELLTDLYVDTNDAVYIYNQGRCYEQNNRCEDAIVRFREYLRKTPDGSEHDRADVKRHIADCEGLLGKKDDQAASPSIAPEAQIPRVIASPPQVEATKPNVRVDLPPPVGEVSPIVEKPAAGVHSGSGLRSAGLLAVGAGGVLVAAGALSNLKYNSMIRDLRGEYHGATDDSAQSYKTLSVVGYGAGAACLVGGAVLYWLGYRKGHAVVTATRLAGTTTLLLAGRF
jgi:hypothetical protein